MLTLLYTWTSSNRNLVPVLLAFKFQRVCFGSLCLRSAWKYSGKGIIFIWNKRKSLQPDLCHRNLLLQIKLWYGIAIDISSYLTICLKSGGENLFQLSWATFKPLLIMAGANSQLWHLMSTTDGSEELDKLPDWYISVSHQWLLHLICLAFFSWSLLNWFLASLFGNLAEALQSGHKIGTMLSNQM